MKKKQPVYKGLNTIPVLFTDQSEYSPEIFDITNYPSRLTAGKNILRFRGNLENLAQNAPLDIEILDYNGEPIYHEVTNYIAEDKSRVIAIYIYPDTSPGPATITLLTEVQFINGRQVPTEWKGLYNVRWSKTVYVNPTLQNESEIIFETLPTVDIEEQVGVQLDRSYTISQFPTYNIGKVKYVSLNNSPALIISGGAFSASMVGGTVTVNNPINPTPTSTFNFSVTPYTSTIKKVLNTGSILLNSPYSIASSQSIFPHTYTNFDNSSYEINYEQTPTYIETQNSESYAIIKINNLQPLTGDISRIKTYINNTGTIGTWEQISDIELDETEIFVTSTSSATPDISIGNIINQSKINTYYDSSDYLNKSLLGPATLTYDTNILNNSMHIVGTGDVTIVKIKDNFAGSFIKNAEYKITLDAVSQKIGTSASMSIYLSGSAFNLDVTDKYNKEFPIQLGKRIGQLTLNDNETFKRYDDQTFSFIADNNGTAVLILLIEGSEWYVSDIRTTSDNDAGYTPNYTRIRALVPTAHKSDVQLNFKIEYYNPAGNKCKQDNIINNVAWAGGNRYIDGEYSMLTGSLYVADSLESGIAISGYSNTGYIRSLGYDGFIAGYPGFLLWSGSALSGQLTKYNNPYAGVGLEMYANSNNYFRYSTADNEIDIHTQTFFLGSPTSYISGSNGNIQISGSNIGLNTENFFLGNSYNFISGSNNRIEINASKITSTVDPTILWNGSDWYQDTIYTSGSILLSGSKISIDSPNVQIGTDANYIRTTNGQITIASGYGKIGESYIPVSGLGAIWDPYIYELVPTMGQGKIVISGSGVSVITPNFFLGNDTNFISGSNGNIRISGSNVSVQTPNFFLGEYGSQFISGSNGVFEISSSNFSVTNIGDVFAKDGTFRGTSTADMFVYRNMNLTGSATNSTTNNIATIYKGVDEKMYTALNLTGSGVGPDGVGAATFVRIQPGSLPVLWYPIGNINIHNPIEYSNNQFTQEGAVLILEAADTFYLTITDGYQLGGGFATTQISGSIPAGVNNGGLNSDSCIAYDPDDAFASMMNTWTMPSSGISYSTTIRIKGGAQVMLAQSRFAWRIVAMSSYDGGIVQFASGSSQPQIRLTNPPTSDPSYGNGRVWVDKSGYLRLEKGTLTAANTNAAPGYTANPRFDYASIPNSSVGLSSGEIYRDASNQLYIKP